MSTVACWYLDGQQTPWMIIPGNFVLHVNIGKISDIGNDGVDRHSGVWATICEVSQPSGEPLDFPFIGAAALAVENIAPQDDGTVLCVIGTNWSSPINYKVQFLVSND
jgi:hypothetical protein